MSVKLLTEHHLEFLSLKGGCTGSSESSLVKISNCWKSHAAAQVKVSPRPAEILMNLNHDIKVRGTVMLNWPLSKSICH